MRESKIEKHLVDETKRRTGGTAYKFKSPGRKNVPDRILLLPGGQVFLVELKATGEQPEEGQLREHERLRVLSFDVRVIDTIAGVDKFLDEVSKC